MTIKNQVRGFAILLSAIILTSCGGGGGGNSGATTASTPPTPAPLTCQSPFLNQVCGTVWMSDCLDQTTHYNQTTVEFNNDETFRFTGRDYSDSTCTTEISSLVFSGDIIERDDILLIDGSTGKKVDLYVNLYDGKVIDPPTPQYTIFQIDLADPNILYMGDTNDTEAQRNANNRVRTIYPFYKQ